MSYAENIRERVLTDKTEEPVRAVAYARVSTDNEGQKESCANQLEMIHNYIQKYPAIQLVKEFVDDGISGKNADTRPEYNAMINMIKSQKIDLIIVKAMSRLNRNELNSYELVDSVLTVYGTTILTIEDGRIHNFEDPLERAMFGLGSTMDASYVRRQSLNGRKTHELRCSRKELSSKDISYGYDWDSNTKTISINEEQAEIVRYVFDEFVFHQATPKQIVALLEKRGKKFCPRTILNFIHDERYIGNFYINKRHTVLGMGKMKSKVVRLPKEEWILVERPDLQIVDTEIFQTAQDINSNRVTIYEHRDSNTTKAYFQGTSVFSTKVFCSECGAVYRHTYADRKKTIPIYSIRNHSQCSNSINRVYESDLETITKTVLETLVANNESIFEELEKILTECVMESRGNGQKVESLKKKKAAKQKKMDELIDSLANGGFTELAIRMIKQRINDISAEIDELNQAIEKLEDGTVDKDFVPKKISQIRVAIDSLKEFQVIDKQTVRNYIERFNVHSNGDIDVILKSGYHVKVDKHILTSRMASKQRENEAETVVQMRNSHDRC